MTILCSTHDSNGKSFKAQFNLPPGSNGSPLHYHNHLIETFEVLSGSLEMEVGFGRSGIWVDGICRFNGGNSHFRANSEAC